MRKNNTYLIPKRLHIIVVVVCVCRQFGVHNYVKQIAGIGNRYSGDARRRHVKKCIKVRTLVSFRRREEMFSARRTNKYSTC